MSATVYATVADIRAVGYPLSEAQESAASTMIEQASARLRLTAKRVGKDIDEMIADPASGTDYALAVKSVIVQSVCRGLDAAQGTGQAIIQGSQTIGSYSVQQTYFNPGQSLYFVKGELKDLGLYRSQRFGALELYASDADGDDA